MPARTPLNLHTNQVLVGSGELYIELLDDDGNPTGGERYLGNSLSFSLTVEESRTIVYSGDGPVATKLLDRVTQKNFSATATVQDMSADNLALLLSGETTAYAADAASPPAETIGPVKADRWYHLGRTVANPVGVLDVKAITTLKYGNSKAAAPGGQLAAEGDDYEWDNRGRVYVKPGGSLDGKWITVDYDTNARKHAGAKTSAATKDLLACVTYLEDSADHGGKNILIPRCSIGASGDTQIKGNREGSQQITLTLGIQQPAGDVAQIYIDGQAL